MAYSTLAEAQDADQRRDDWLEAAAEIVQRYAPAPDPEPDDYAEKAARAERLIYGYLSMTQGAVVQSRTLSGLGSYNYRPDSEIRRIVREQMGDYYAASESVVHVEHF